MESLLYGRKQHSALSLVSGFSSHLKSHPRPHTSYIPYAHSPPPDPAPRSRREVQTRVHVRPAIRIAINTASHLHGCREIRSNHTPPPFCSRCTKPEPGCLFTEIGIYHSTFQCQLVQLCVCVCKYVCGERERQTDRQTDKHRQTERCEARERERCEVFWPSACSALADPENLEKPAGQLSC